MIIFLYNLDIVDYVLLAASCRLTASFSRKLPDSGQKRQRAVNPQSFCKLDLEIVAFETAQYRRFNRAQLQFSFSCSHPFHCCVKACYSCTLRAAATWRSARAAGAAFFSPHAALVLPSSIPPSRPNRHTTFLLRHAKGLVRSSLFHRAQLHKSEERRRKRFRLSSI